MDTPGLITHQTITTIVENVDQARHDIDQAFKLLQGAKARLAAVLGDGSATLATMTSQQPQPRSMPGKHARPGSTSWRKPESRIT